MPALVDGRDRRHRLCLRVQQDQERMFGYDDALDAFGVHGVGGTLGAILTGVFATRACWDIGAGQRRVGTKLGLIEGGTVLKGQIVAVAVTWVFSIVATFIILKVVDAIVGLRVTPRRRSPRPRRHAARRRRLHLRVADQRAFITPQRHRDRRAMMSGAIGL